MRAGQARGLHVKVRRRVGTCLWLRANNIAVGCSPEATKMGDKIPMEYLAKTLVVQHLSEANRCRAEVAPLKGHRRTAVGGRPSPIGTIDGDAGGIT